MNFRKSKELSSKAQKLIPGGGHTYAKGDDQYPEHTPPIISKGAGCHVWDVDGNEFIEYGMGLRAVTLGHAYGPVVEAAYEQLRLGNNYTRPAAIEAEYAEALLDVVPRADMAKFAKDGSTVTTAAIRLARAATGRVMVAYCSDHPFFSYDDWFIGKTPMNAGCPEQISEMSLGFRYNDPESLSYLFAKYPGAIACVILEPEKDVAPESDFLHAVRELCDRNGALLIFDEMITGFRWAIGGAQEVYDVSPDLSTFGKGMANGFALSALLGVEKIMALGGLQHRSERVFLLSTTHGAENHAIAAAAATLAEYQQKQVIGRLNAQGEKLLQGISSAAEAAGLGDYFKVTGRPCNLAYAALDETGTPSQDYRTLVLQELIARGILAPSLVVSFSHADEDIARTVAAFSEVFEIYKLALENGIENYLVGRPVKPVFRPRN